MKLKNYIKLMFHVVVTLLIIVSLPIALRIILYSRINDWSVLILSLLSVLITIFFGMKYVHFIVWKKDLFEDMF